MVIKIGDELFEVEVVFEMSQIRFERALGNMSAKRCKRFLSQLHVAERAPDHFVGAFMTARFHLLVNEGFQVCVQMNGEGHGALPEFSANIGIVRCSGNQTPNQILTGLAGSESSFTASAMQVTTSSGLMIFAPLFMASFEPNCAPRN